MKGYIKLTFLSEDKSQGIKGDFLVDTGADICIINNETYNAIKITNPNLKLVPVTSATVRAINKTTIKFEGMIQLKFQIDDEEYINLNDPIEFTHTFWVASKDSVKSNILGIDWLVKQCESMKFSENSLILKKYTKREIELASKRTTDYPFFEKIQAIKLSNKENIDVNSIRKISIKLKTKIEPNAYFYANKEFQINEIEYVKPYFIEKQSEFPLLCINKNEKEITLPKIIGYITNALPNQKQYSLLKDLPNNKKIRNLFQERNEPKIPKNIKKDLELNEVEMKTKKEKKKLEVEENLKLKSNEPIKIGNTTLYQVFKPQPGNKYFKEFFPTNHEILLGMTDADKEFLCKFDFTTTPLESVELRALFFMLITNSDVFSYNKYDIGSTTEKFLIKLKPGTKLVKQRPTKVPLQHAEKLEKTLKQMLKAGIIREVQMSEKNGGKLGSEHPNPVILIPKGDVLKVAIDARYLNSITDTEQYSWPLEPLQDKLLRIKGKWFSIIDLNQAYHQVSLEEGKYGTDHTCFSIKDVMYQFIKGFYGLKALPPWFSYFVRRIFAELVEMGKAMTYLDDILLMTESKEETFHVIEKFLQCLRTSKIKAAPEKAFFFQKEITYLGHVITEFGRKPISSKVEALKKLKTPENRLQLMSVLGKVNYYDSYFDAPIHKLLNPLHKKANETGEFIWTPQDEKIFRDVLETISAETIRINPDPKYPFEIYVDSSNIGIGCILINIQNKKRKIVSFNSRGFDIGEQKLSTTARELAGLIWSLKTYQPIIDGTPFPLKIYTDHKPILYLFAKKGSLNHRLFKYMLFLTNFISLEIHWTPGKSLPLPDELSRVLNADELAELQLTHKKIPKEIKFFKNGNPISYTIEHTKDIKNKGTFDPEDIFPIIKNENGKSERIIYKGKNMEEEISNISECEIEKCIPLSVLVKMGKHVKEMTRELKNSESQNQNQNLELEEKQLSEIELKNCNIENISMNEFEEMIEEMEIENIKNQIENIRENLSEKEINEIDKEGDFENYKIDITLDVILIEQDNDKTLSQVKKWLKDKIEKPNLKNTRAQPILLKFAKMYEHLYLCPKTGLLYIFIQSKKLEEEKPRGEFLTEPKIVAPMSLILQIIDKYHNGYYVGHMGLDKTLAGIEEIYYMPGLFKWVKAYITACISCQENKHVKKHCQSAKLKSPMRTVNKPMDVVHIDFKGPINPGSNGKSYVYLLVDTFTKFIQGYATNDATTNTAIKYLEDFITHFGIPTTIVCDRGPCFTSHEFVSYCDSMGIKLCLLSGYNPWANGKIEVYNKYIGNYIRITSLEPKYWSNNIGNWTLAINTSQISHFSMTPYELMFGRKPNITTNLRLGKGSNKENICDPEDSDYEEICEKLPEHNHTIPNILTKELIAYNKDTKTKEILERELKFCRLYKSAMKLLKIDNPDVYAKRNLHLTGTTLKIGDLALVENKQIKKGTSEKLQQLRKGIFQVVNIASDETYVLTNIDTGEKIMRARIYLLPYKPLLEIIGDLTKKYPEEELETKFLWVPEPKIELYKQKIKILSEKLEWMQEASGNSVTRRNMDSKITFDWENEFKQLDTFGLLDKLDKKDTNSKEKSQEFENQDLINPFDTKSKDSNHQNEFENLESEKGNPKIQNQMKKSKIQTPNYQNKNKNELENYDQNVQLKDKLLEFSAINQNILQKSKIQNRTKLNRKVKFQEHENIIEPENFSESEEELNFETKNLEKFQPKIILNDRIESLKPEKLENYDKFCSIENSHFNEIADANPLTNSIISKYNLRNKNLEPKLKEY